MMEWLNNVNVILGIIVAIFGIGGYIFGIVHYLRGRAAKSIRESKTLIQSPVSRAKEEKIAFDHIDWINAFAKGFYKFMMGGETGEPIPSGCIFLPLFALMACVVIGGIFFAIFSFVFSWNDTNAGKGAFVVGLICWLTILLAIYIHFVGEAVDEIIAKKRGPILQSPMYNKRTSYRRKY